MSRALKISSLHHLNDVLLMNDGSVIGRGYSDHNQLGYYREGYKNNFEIINGLKDIVNVESYYFSTSAIDINGDIHIIAGLTGGKVATIKGLNASKTVHYYTDIIILLKNGTLCSIDTNEIRDINNIGNLVKYISLSGVDKILDICVIAPRLYILTYDGILYKTESIKMIDKLEYFSKIGDIKSNIKLIDSHLESNSIIATLPNLSIIQLVPMSNSLHLYKYTDIVIPDNKLYLSSISQNHIIYYADNRVLILNSKNQNKYTIALNNVTSIKSNDDKYYFITDDGIFRFIDTNSLTTNINKFKIISLYDSDFYDVPLSLLSVIQYRSILGRLAQYFKSLDTFDATLYGAILSIDYLRYNINPLTYNKRLSDINNIIIIPQKQITINMRDNDILVNENSIVHSSFLIDLISSFESNTEIQVNSRQYDSKLLINILAFYDKYTDIQIMNPLITTEIDEYFDNDYSIDNFSTIVDISNYFNFRKYLYCFCGFLFRKSISLKDNDRQDLFNYRYFALPIIQSSNNWIEDELLSDVISNYIYGDNKENLIKQFLVI